VEECALQRSAQPAEIVHKNNRSWVRPKGGRGRGKKNSAVVEPSGWRASGRRDESRWTRKAGCHPKGNLNNLEGSEDKRRGKGRDHTLMGKAGREGKVGG